MPELELGKTEADSSGIFPLFDVNGYVISHVTYLGILMTYGVVFPPLAVVMCVTMLSIAAQARLSLGRFLHFAREQSAPQLADTLSTACKGAVSMNLLRSSIFLITCFACCFYALFLFDTLGDAVSLRGAYWVLIAMPLLPAVLYGLDRFHHQYRRSPDDERQVGFSLDGGVLELQSRGGIQDPAVQHMGGADAVTAEQDEAAVHDVTYNVLNSP
jgi:hypothetical protein